MKITNLTGKYSKFCVASSSSSAGACLFYFVNKKKKNPLEKLGQSGGASCWRVCYQQGLPRLAFTPSLKP